ncbi:two-component response regulator [Desulfocucumis palustris]|uniref:Stage 0 sporulation protein A homolog n=1 Tax=Desulfocucumis palustris TaxID=1898651 RepID=A0A2L2XDL7_9FIRM|nr:response regulator transcription factor [Desulfocucumis palustris]GBF32316.1 two-component response regulator [Desulfocucumis palustris]
MAKILIVDDEPNIRLLLEQTLGELEEQGIELLTEENGWEALEKIIYEKPELVFLDVMMPKMNGDELCDIVKNRMRITDPYIVLLTAGGQEFDRQKGAGADMCMTKPFDPEEILEKAREVLRL